MVPCAAWRGSFGAARRLPCPPWLPKTVPRENPALWTWLHLRELVLEVTLRDFLHAATELPGFSGRQRAPRLQASLLMADAAEGDGCAASLVRSARSPPQPAAARRAHVPPPTRGPRASPCHGVSQGSRSKSDPVRGCWSSGAVPGRGSGCEDPFTTAVRCAPRRAARGAPCPSEGRRVFMCRGGGGDLCHRIASCGIGAGKSEIPRVGHPARSWCCSRRPGI